MCVLERTLHWVVEQHRPFYPERVRHMPITDQHKMLSLKLRGHYQYFGITGNSQALSAYLLAAKRLWRQWLARRSNKAPKSWQWFVARGMLIGTAWPRSTAARAEVLGPHPQLVFSPMESWLGISTSARRNRLELTMTQDVCFSMIPTLMRLIFACQSGPPPQQLTSGPACLTKVLDEQESGVASWLSKPGWGRTISLPVCPNLVMLHRGWPQTLPGCEGLQADGFIDLMMCLPLNEHAAGRGGRHELGGMRYLAFRNLSSKMV